MIDNQEPVAKLKTSNVLLRCHRCGFSDKLNMQIEYTHPPQRTEQERDEILQAITDPENQPSQFGTVTLQYHQKKMKQWEDLFDRMISNFERASDKAIAQRIVPLYTISPQRTWVGLTDERREQLVQKCWSEYIAGKEDGTTFGEWMSVATEAELKEKNT